jgi:hypothetical protein
MTDRPVNLSTVEIEVAPSACVSFNLKEKKAFLRLKTLVFDFVLLN